MVRLPTDRQCGIEPSSEEPEAKAFHHRFWVLARAGSSQNANNPPSEYVLVKCCFEKLPLYSFCFLLID